MIVSNRTAIFYLFITTTLWAGNMILGRLFHEELPALQLSFWRWALAAVLILVIMRPPLRQDWPLIWQNKLNLLIIGTFGIGAYNTLQYISLQKTSATNVSLILAAMPVLIMLFDKLAYRTKIPAIQIIGMGCASLGVIMVLAKGDIGNLTSLDFNIGDLCMVSAISIYAIFSVLLQAAPKINQWSLLFVLFVIGALELLPFMLFERADGKYMVLHTGTVLAIAYIVIGPALLAYKFYTSAVATLGPNRSGFFFYWLPIAAAGMAVVVLDERMAFYHLFGFILVVMGLRFGLTDDEKDLPKKKSG